MTIADMVTNDVAGINHVHNSQSARRWPRKSSICDGYARDK